MNTKAYGPVEFIAEIGSNYNNNLETAKKYIQDSYKNGATAVKFQTIKKNKFIAPKVRQGKGFVPHPAWDNFGNLELPDPWHFELKKHADEVGIEFLSTPFYLEAIQLLENVGIPRYKIASGDITFHPLLEEIGRTGKPVLLSTGGSTITEIDNAVNILTKSGSGPITLLHCVVSYPPDYEEVNLLSIVTMKQTFELDVGLSDHTPGSVVALGAAALGASVIEKHVTFDRSLPGPDHPFAMTMPEFKSMVEKVRIIEKALGTGEKQPSLDEKKRQHRYRRAVYDPVTLKPTNQPKGLWLRPDHKVVF